MQIQSLKALYKELKETHNIKYILTNRLNQDALESTFSVLREKGGLYDHPSPLNALHRLKLIILGKPNMQRRNTNILHNEELDKSLVQLVLQRSKIQVEEKVEDDSDNDDSYSLATLSVNSNEPDPRHSYVL